MPDYSKGRIYAIRAPGTDEVYIGSTCCPLSKRMANHRDSYKNYLAGKHHFVSSFRLLEKEGAYIELIEEFPCSTREQLNRREGEIIRATAGCVNTCIAGRTQQEQKKEWRAKNLDKRRECERKYAATYRAKKAAAAISQPPVE